MKQTDIDRLKEICEKEGFEVVFASNEGVLFQIEKKDPWDGVEFVKSKSYGVIYKIISQTRDSFIYNLRGLQGLSSEGESYKYFKSEFRPSTESAYVDQIKKECFERYGEIKYGDKFQSDWCDIKPIQTIGHGSYEFSYWKNTDTLLFNGVSMYQSGKWAKKLPERVEVSSCPETTFQVVNDEGDIEFTVKFKTTFKNYFPCQDSADYLAKQLESYLNKKAGN